MKKKLLSLILVAVCFCNSISMYAEETNTKEDSIVEAENSIQEAWILNNDDADNIYIENCRTGEKIIEAWKYDDLGRQVNIDLCDYVNELNQGQDEQVERAEDIYNRTNEMSIPVLSHASPQSLVMPVEITNYTEESNSVVNGSPIKITADVKGKATISYGNMTTVSESFTVSGTTTTEAIKNKIRLGAGFTWNKSATSNSSFGITYTVPAGKTGYITFTPKYNKTVGTYRVRFYLENRLLTDDSYSVTAKSPISLSNGFADGTYALVVK